MSLFDLTVDVIATHPTSVPERRSYRGIVATFGSATGNIRTTVITVSNLGRAATINSLLRRFADLFIQEPTLIVHKGCAISRVFLRRVPHDGA